MLYQLPLLLSRQARGVCLVILPLKALMHDQEKALRRLGIGTRPPGR